MNKSYKYLPQSERKKIVLISDDIRVTSGVSTIGREIVLHTAHHFNWVNIGGSMKHPEFGKVLDLSQDINKHAKIDDSYCMLYPSNGYGDMDFLRKIIKRENPDAIMLITDPRYFTWLFTSENEVRKKMPIIYLNIWDDFPVPHYNLPYYESCDVLLAISKQTKLINQLVLEEGNVPYIDLDK